MKSSMVALSLLGALAIYFGEAQGQVCGDSLNNLDVKSFPTNQLDLVEGDWYVLGYLTSKISSLADTQCIHFQYHPDPATNSINVTKHQRFCNQTRVQVEQKILFRSSNVIDYYNDYTNTNSSFLNYHIIHFDITNTIRERQFLIYYYCTENTDGSKRTLFMMLTREFAQGPNLYVVYQEIESLRKVRENADVQGNLKVFGDVCGCQEEDPKWTTTTTTTQ